MVPGIPYISSGPYQVCTVRYKILELPENTGVMFPPPNDTKLLSSTYFVARLLTKNNESANDKVRRTVTFGEDWGGC